MLQRTIDRDLNLLIAAFRSFQGPKLESGQVADQESYLKPPTSFQSTPIPIPKATRKFLAIHTARQA